MKIIDDFKEWLTLNGHSSFTYVPYIRRFLKETSYKESYILRYNSLNTNTNSMNIYINKNISNYVTNILLNEVLIKNFIIKYKQQYSVETVNLYIKSIKTFSKFLKVNINIPKLFKRDKQLPDYLTLEYLEQEVLPAVEITFPNNKLRYTTLLYFDFFTGIRRGEHYYLKREHFDLKKKLVKVYAPKTKEERIVPLNNRVVKMLEEYFESEPEQQNAFNLGVGGVRYIYDTLKPNFTPEVNLRPHLMRHSGATHWLMNGMDVKEVQQLLGHKNILTTMRYLGNYQPQLWDKFRTLIK